MNAAAVTAFGNGPLYIVNWTPGSPPTCQLASTIGGTPIVPPGAASTLYFAPRPVANPAPPLAVGNAQFDPHGYQAQYICSMAAGLAAGLTEPGISAAMTAALTRYTPAGNYGNPPWLEWWMDPTISWCIDGLPSRNSRRDRRSPARAVPGRRAVGGEGRGLRSDSAASRGIAAICPHQPGENCHLTCFKVRADAADDGVAVSMRLRLGSREGVFLRTK